jgi:leucyl-tRNA synthetase
MLSDSPPERDVIWSEEGIQGAGRYVQQVWRLIAALKNVSASGGFAHGDSYDLALRVRRAAHGHVLRIQENIERLRFNTAIAEIRKLSNVLGELVDEVTATPVAPDIATAFREASEFLVQAFAPMMPHFAEECWTALGHSNPVAETDWPRVDMNLATSDEVTIVVQLNGKRRADFTIERGADSKVVEQKALSLDAVRSAIDGKPVKKIIVVPNRIVNVVI